MKMSDLKKLAEFEDFEDQEDVSAARSSGFMNIGPTLGTLEHAILTDIRLSEFEKKHALRQLQKDTGFASPGTPLSSILPKLGGGVLGALIARMLGLGGLGMGIAALGGYGLGKIIADYYRAQSPTNSQNNYMLR